MKIEMGKKYKTRDGRDVRIYAVDGFGTYCVHGAYYDVADYGEVGWIDDTWTANGEVVEGQKGFDLELVGVKEDWEIAEVILKKRKTIFLKIGNEIYLVEKLDEHDLDDSLFVTCHNENYIGVFKKEEIKLATKEEVIEYFFGSENEK